MIEGLQRDLERCPGRNLAVTVCRSEGMMKNRASGVALLAGDKGPGCGVTVRTQYTAAGRKL